MDDTYTLLQVIARSWGAMFLLLSFLAVILFTMRPGSRQVHRDTADIPFRYDDAPAPDRSGRAEDANQMKEARR